jgi:hypothetical protein
VRRHRACQVRSRVLMTGSKAGVCPDRALLPNNASAPLGSPAQSTHRGQHATCPRWFSSCPLAHATLFSGNGKDYLARRSSRTLSPGSSIRPCFAPAHTIRHLRTPERPGMSPTRVHPRRLCDAPETPCSYLNKVRLA